MKKEDKIVVGVGLFVFFSSLLAVGLVLFLRKRDEEALLEENAENAPPQYTYQSPAVDRKISVKDADTSTVLYIQKSINTALGYLQVMQVQNVPKDLVLDGVFGKKTRDALNYLFGTFAGITDAHERTLTELRTILKDNGISVPFFA